MKLKPPSFVPNRQEVVHDIRKTVGGAICDPDDILIDVLDDNDYVAIGKGHFFKNYLKKSWHQKFAHFCPGKSRGEFVLIFGAVSLYQVILKRNGL